MKLFGYRLIKETQYQDLVKRGSDYFFVLHFVLRYSENKIERLVKKLENMHKTGEVISFKL